MKLKVNITVKLIGYLVVVGVLPLLTFAFISYSLVRDTVVNQARGYSAQLLETQKEYLQQQQELVENLASRIAGAEEISAVIFKTDAMDQEHNAYDSLSTQVQIRQILNDYSNLQGVVSIDLFTVKGHRFYVGDTLSVPQVNEQTRLRFFRTGLASQQSVLWLGVENNLNSASPNRKVLTALKILRRYSEQKETSEPIGMLLINYSTNYLSDHFHKVDMGQDSYLLIADSTGNLAYAPDKTKIGTALPAELHGLGKAESGTALLRLDQGNAFVSFTCLNRSSWCVFGVIPEHTLLAPMMRLTEFAALLLFVCLAVTGIAIRLIRRSMLAPITKITDGFRKIKDNQFDNVEPLPVHTSRDEIGELVAWFNAFLDALRARRQYEDELRDSQFKFSSIFQLSPIPLGLTRIHTGEFVDVNDFWLNQFGYKRDEVIGRTSFELGIWVDTNDRLKAIAQMELTRSVHCLETKQRAKDGRILDCELSGRPFEFRNELMFIFSPVDVTRQHAVEQEIREINLELESRVRSRTLKLEQANYELGDAMESLKRTKSDLVRSEKMAALGSLVAGVAHELNTPIGNCVTVASTLQDQSLSMYRQLKTGGVHKSTIVDYFEMATAGSELLMRNLGNARELLTGFKQVAVDQASNQRRRFDLKETLEGIMTTLVPLYKKTAYTLHYELQGEIEMDSYPGPLGQILTNFVTNALNHAFEGRPSGQMSLRCRSLDETHVEITFGDNGIGIPEEHHKRVFDPFFTTKLGQGGSGLGLNIVYNIVTSLLGGSIELESTVDVGTTFIIVLPLYAPDMAHGQN